MVAKNLLMMLTHSVAGILMLTIGLSLIHLGSSRISPNQMPLENIMSLQPVEMINSTISPNMPNEWSNNTGAVDPSSQSYLVVSSLLEHEKFRINLKYHLTESCLSELENYQESLQSQLNDSQRRQDNIQEKHHNLVSKSSIGILNLSADLHQKQETIMKITQDYNKLDYKYMELEKSYSIDKQKIEKMNNKVEILQLNIRDKVTDLYVEKKNNKILFDAKTLCENELLTTRLENEELHYKLLKLNDTLITVSQDQENLGKTLEIAKLDSENKKKSLNICELKMKDIINEKNNMEVRTKIEVDQLNDENKKLIEVHTENIKTIENECQSNVTNKQQEIKMMKNDIFKKSLVELADLSNTLISIMKLNEDNIPDDLLEKRRRLFQNQYDENQIEVVNYIRKLFDDIASTSNHKFPNKYFCNKKISYYDSNICALLSESSNSHRVNMKSVNLSVIPKDTFTECKEVVFLDLSFNRLNYLESGTFNGLLALKELWIYKNNLTTLQKDIFNGLEKLETLRLDSNRLNYLESGTFNGLSNLKRLWMHENNLTTLPKDIFNGLKKLEILSLMPNQLNYLESGTFNGLSRLRTLDIQKNHLTALPRNILNDLKNLKNLDLSDNRLNSLESGTFNGLSNLSTLHISQNNLTTLEKDIFNGLEKLKVLVLDSNRLNYLKSGTFNGLSNLNKLFINQNNLTTLPKDIFNGLEKLEYLRLDSNRLNYLESGTFNGLSNLNTLHINQNNLTTLPINIFNGLEKLEILSLYSNQLNYLESGTFNGLLALKELRIYKNNLTTLPKNIFNDLEKLELLHLRLNRLNYLEPGTFNGLLALKELWINENHLATLPKDIFDGLKKLESLFLSANRLNSLKYGTLSSLSNLKKLYIDENNLTTCSKHIFGLDNLEILYC